MAGGFVDDVRRRRVGEMIGAANISCDGHDAHRLKFLKRAWGDEAVDGDVLIPRWIERNDLLSLRKYFRHDGATEADG